MPWWPGSTGTGRRRQAPTRDSAPGVCVREIDRESEREREREREIEREKERERECVCVCVRERERDRSISVKASIACGGSGDAPPDGRKRITPGRKQAALRATKAFISGFDYVSVTLPAGTHMCPCGSMEVPAVLSTIQGYLAYKKPPPP